MLEGDAAPAVVLIVEDEVLLRMHAADIFAEFGFTVIEAADADAAIVILESRDDIRLVFTDVQMPGSMDGLRLVAAIRNRWPPIALIVASGAWSPGADGLPTGVSFVAKPFDRLDLLRATHRVFPQ